ncbi:MAG TPA: hypothetical protein VN222_05245 [Novosphingobium sp.]|nr:hypothetical protein [Novosphingobium sp.]
MSQSAPSTLRPHVRPAPAPSTNAAPVQKLTPALMWTMAAAAGAGVANVYYNQPLLDQIRASFGISTTTVGWVPTLT